MTVYDCTFLCIPMYEYIWICMTLSDYVWLCFTLYSSIWLCMILHDYIWLCMTAWLSKTMYDYMIIDDYFLNRGLNKFFNLWLWDFLIQVFRDFFHFATMCNLPKQTKKGGGWHILTKLFPAVSYEGVRGWELGLSTCLLVQPMTPR